MGSSLTVARQCRTKTVEKPGDTATPRELDSVVESPHLCAGRVW